MIDADLVFIHGFWSSSATWDRLIRRIEADEDLDGLRVHPFDYESPKLPRPMGTTRIPDYDDIAQTLPTFLQHTCPGDTAIITHSQGGLILQRYLAWMLGRGRGRELARIKLIVMLACPNEGSEYLGTIRRLAGFSWHPQARDLKVLSEKVIETRQTVVDRVIYADGVDDYHCRIPIYAYAGQADNIVKRKTAQSIFQNAATLPGDHSSILDPDAPGHLTFQAIKGHLLEMAGRGAVTSASLAGDGETVADVGPFPAPKSPPPDDSDLKVVIKHFTGRKDQVDAVKREIHQNPDPRAIQSIFHIHGMPGIGKTALAGYLVLQLADELRDSVFRAGMRQIIRQVDLSGLEPVGRLDPGTKLREWLSPTYKPEEIPADIEGIAALWRRHLVSQDAFLILLLDDAGGADQVWPFLPGGRFVVLVTSRRELAWFQADVDATPVPLPVLGEGEAADLIRAMARRAASEQDDGAVQGIAAFCDYLPLAMTLVAKRLAGRPKISFADQLAQLKSRPKRLAAIDGYLDGDSRGVARAFELSYTQLPEPCQLLLRRLSLVPLPAISEETAAALSGWSADEVRPYLLQLEAEGLVSQQDDGFHLHDLIREYARSLADEDDPADNAAAIGRVLGYHYAAAVFVDGLLTRQPPPLAVEPPYPGARRDQPSRQSAIAWVRDELPNFRALVDLLVHEAAGGDAAASGWVVLFASALAGLLRNDGLWLESIDLQTRAIAPAVRLDNPLAEANALHERAQLYRLSSQLDKAVLDLERALILYRAIDGDPGVRGESNVLTTYGVVLDQKQQPAAAQERFDQAMAGYRRLGDRLGEANVLHDEGMKEYFAGKSAERDGLPGQALVCYQAAADLLSRALAVFAEVDHPLGQAHARLNLGRAERKAGQPLAATANLDVARGLYHELGNQLGEATILVELGEARRSAPQGEMDGEAVQDLRKAERIGKRIGNQRVRGTALEQLGELYFAKSHRARAVARFRQALQIYRANGLDGDENRLVKRLVSLGLLDETESSGE